MTLADIRNARAVVESEGLAAARENGHDMHPPFEDRERPRQSRAVCRRCGMNIRVRVELPDADHLDLAVTLEGEALTKRCGETWGVVKGG